MSFFFRPLFHPRGRNENFKTLLHGRTELGNNNIPELSLESAGIIMHTNLDALQMDKDNITFFDNDWF